MSAASGPPRGPREGGYGRGPRDRDEGGYGRGPRDRDDGEGRGDSVRDRLRARARKKARRQHKKRGFIRRKVCRFCADKHIKIDYRDPKTLRLFVTETGKMIPRRISGNCAKHQRPLAMAIKRARILALVPYAASHS